MSPLKYPGRVLTASDNDWTIVVGNLRKARKKLAWLSSILGWEGENLQVLGIFFKAVVLEVLLFGSNMWVMNPRTDWARVF